MSSKNIVIRKGKEPPYKWKAEWDGIQAKITSPAGTVIYFTEYSQTALIDDARAIKTGEIIGVYAYPDVCYIEPDEPCECTIPVIKDPESFEYFKKDHPEWCDKEVHGPEDFFPLP